MRANRYLHIAVICATLIFLVLWQTAAAGPPEKPGNPGLPGCLAKVSELEERIEELEDMLQNFAAVPQTGQKSCWDENGAPLDDCDDTGQDGDLQKGVEWSADGRFTDNENGTVTDNLTGLVLLQDADCFGQKPWLEALSESNELNSGECGLTDGSIEGDWRLPNIRELHSLIDFGNYGLALPTDHPFDNVQSGYYWSSTTCAVNPDGPWGVVMGDGRVYRLNKHDYFPSVWPVRSDND